MKIYRDFLDFIFLCDFEQSHCHNFRNEILNDGLDLDIEIEKITGQYLGGDIDTILNRYKWRSNRSFEE